MLSLSSPLAATLLAAAGGAGGSGLLPILLFVVVIVVFFLLPMRRQKKVRETLKQRQSEMVPGTRVMTQFGLFGTVVSTDPAENTAVLRIAPGTEVVVYLPAVTTVLDENGRIPGSPEAARAAAAAPAAPEDNAEAGADLHYDPSHRDDASADAAESAGRSVDRGAGAHREDLAGRPVDEDRDSRTAASTRSDATGAESARPEFGQHEEGLPAAGETRRPQLNGQDLDDEQSGRGGSAR